MLSRNAASLNDNKQPQPTPTNQPTKTNNRHPLNI